VSKLYIELYLDDNVDVLVAKILRARGFSVLTVDGAGRKGLLDSDQLKFAVEGSLAIVSMDRVDFAKYWPKNISTRVKNTSEYSSLPTIRRR